MINDGVHTDTMFSLRENTFRKLGTVLQEPPTAKEALEAAKLDWKVELEEMYRKSPDGVLIEVPKLRALVRSDDGKQIGLATAEYTPLQNETALEVFNPLVEHGLAEFTTAGALHGGRNVWVQIKLNITDPRITDVFQREVQPYTVVDNSHSGTRSVRMYETPIRVWCQNALNAARNSGTMVTKLRHDKNVEVNLIAAAQELWKGLIEKYVVIAGEYKQLKNTYLDEAMFRTLVLDKAVPLPSNRAAYSKVDGLEKAIAKAEEKRFEITKLWMGGTQHTGDHSAWEAYNGFTEWFDHVRTTRANQVEAMLGGATAHTSIMDGLLEHAKS